MAEVNSESSGYNATVNAVLDSIVADITALDTAVDALASDLNVITVKLNSDGGVSDADYATDHSGAAAMTTTTD